jgi:hypothetical protein
MKPAAFKLPHLLATLPRSGRNMLVRQVDWPTNSFVKVARTKLRYLETGDNKPLKAAGKAWGYLFWKGAYMCIVCGRCC